MNNHELTKLISPIKQLHMIASRSINLNKNKQIFNNLFQ